MTRRLSIHALALALTLPATAAHAFCGFFVSGADAKLTNNASQVVLMRKGDRTVMSMSNNYKGPPEDFAMVVPVPVILQEADVKTLPHDVFDKIDALSAPRLVEYWEQDPCYQPRVVVQKSMVMVPSAPGAVADSAAEEDLGVTIEAQFKVGEYEIVILSAKEAAGLETWLHQNKYTIPKGASEALAPYIQGGMKFFVAKVDIEKVKRDAHGAAVLSPLRFAFPSPELRLPVRLGLLNANGQQDLLVYVLHPESRFEVANYLNVFIPSNLEVTDSVRHKFGSFYAQLFDETLKKAGKPAVVTEYAWQTTSCDPCPVPPLTPSDLYTLGGDALGEGGGPTPEGQPEAKPGQPYFGPFTPWVLTRLHTRYSKETLDEDLVFTQARPVFGGRALGGGQVAEGAGSVEMSNINNFQGRYIIRHYWEGEVKCDNPVYGRWGGPPGGRQKTEIAKDLANAPRGEVALAEVVRSNLPQLGLPGKPAPKRAK